MIPKSSRPKSNRLALILSGIIPGLGQFYSEDWLKGTLFFVASIALDSQFMPEGYFNIAIDLIKGNILLSGNLVARLLFLAAFRVWCIYDADQSVRRKNAASQPKIT